MARVCLALILTFTATALFAQAAPDDAVLKLAEPDFTLVALPTSLRLPQYGSAIRITHRFTRPLNCDTCANSLAGDGFSIDGGAQIGLEYRFGIVPNGQLVVHRSSDKTVNLSGLYGITRQSAGMPVEVAALVGIEATNVGRKDTASEYSPVVGAVIGHTLGEDAAFYVEPMFVHHATVFHLAGPGNNDSTFMVGLGTRVKVRPTVYVTAEFTPRVSGYKPGVNQGSFAIEKRAGGHMFQLNVSNGLSTTTGGLARGGPSGNDWYLGFNLTRKFF